MTNLSERGRAQREREMEGARGVGPDRPSWRPAHAQEREIFGQRVLSASRLTHLSSLPSGEMKKSRKASLCCSTPPSLAPHVFPSGYRTSLTPAPTTCWAFPCLPACLVLRCFHGGSAVLSCPVHVDMGRGERHSARPRCIRPVETHVAHKRGTYLLRFLFWCFFCVELIESTAVAGDSKSPCPVFLMDAQHIWYDATVTPRVFRAISSCFRRTRCFHWADLLCLVGLPSSSPRATPSFIWLYSRVGRLGIFPLLFHDTYVTAAENEAPKTDLISPFSQARQSSVNDGQARGWLITKRAPQQTKIGIQLRPRLLRHCTKTCY